MLAALLSLILVGLTRQAFAAVFITNPVATTNAQGGQALTINWQDDGSSPTLAEIGPCEIGLYAGNMQQQTELQPIAPSVDVSKQTSQDFNINAALGPNFNSYFIRFTSLSLKDATNSQFPYEAFSAKFALSGMSGSFSPSVQAQVNGVTSASGAATPTGAAATASAAPTASASTPSGITTARVSTTTNSAPKSSTTSTSAAPAQSNAALVTRSNMGVFSAVTIAALLGLAL